MNFLGKKVNMKICPNCGKSVLKRNNKFCDKNCLDSYVIKVSDENYLKGNLLDPKSVKSAYLRHNPEICVCCKIGPNWNGKILVLQLDHIDGNSDNNNPLNLQLLCPNCHSQTETFGSSQTKLSGTIKKTRRNSYLQVYKSKIYCGVEQSGSSLGS